MRLATKQLLVLLQGGICCGVLQKVCNADAADAERRHARWPGAGSACRSCDASLAPAGTGRCRSGPLLRVEALIQAGRITAAAARWRQLVATRSDAAIAQLGSKVSQASSGEVGAAALAALAIPAASRALLASAAILQAADGIAQRSKHHAARTALWPTLCRALLQGPATPGCRSRGRQLTRGVDILPQRAFGAAA